MVFQLAETSRDLSLKSPSSDGETSSEASSWLTMEMTSCLLCPVDGLSDSEGGEMTAGTMVGGRSASGSIEGKGTEGAGSVELLVVDRPV